MSGPDQTSPGDVLGGLRQPASGGGTGGELQQSMQESRDLCEGEMQHSCSQAPT